jgi:hypothetical protein
VGCTCALPIEVAAAKGVMDEEYGDPWAPPRRADRNAYILGCIGKFEVVVTCLLKDEIGASPAVARDIRQADSVSQEDGGMWG